MKKKLVTYLLISALAVAIFSSCGKRDEDGDAPAADAADAGTVENIVTGDAPEEDIVGKTVETVEDTVEAGTIEAVAAAKAAAEMNEDADTSETAVEANTDATGKEAAEAVDTAAEMSEDPLKRLPKSPLKRLLRSLLKLPPRSLLLQTSLLKTLRRLFLKTEQPMKYVSVETSIPLPGNTTLTSSISHIPANI